MAENWPVILIVIPLIIGVVIFILEHTIYDQSPTPTPKTEQSPTIEAQVKEAEDAAKRAADSLFVLIQDSISK